MDIKPKRLAVGGRVSTDRQEKEETILVQKFTVEDWNEKTKEGVIVDYYLDDGWSGEILARPELDRLRDDANKDLWDAVVWVDRDRIARKLSYQELIIDELREKGKEVIFLNEPLADNPEGRIMQQIKGVFAEYERAKIAERMRRGKIRKAKEKRLVGHQAPYGYRYILKNQEKDGYFEIYEPEAEIVRMVFGWVAHQGYSMHRVVKELYAMKIPPSKKKSERWVKSSVARMLNREDYIGTSYYNRREAIVPKNPIKIEKYKKVKKSSRRLRPKEEWYPIPVPALIDKSLFDLAHQRMKENFLYGKRNKSYDYLLTGKVMCACGARRVGDGDKTHHYYRCAARIYNYPVEADKCEFGGVNAEILDAMVWNKTLELFSQKTIVKSQADRWSKKQSDTVDESQDELERLESALEKLRDEEKRYLKAFGSRLITFDQFEENMKDVKAKRGAIELQIKEYVERVPTDAINLNSFDDICDTLYHSMKYASASDRQEYMRQLIVSIYVGERRKAVVNGRIPLIEQPQNIGYESISRNCRASECWEIHFI